MLEEPERNHDVERGRTERQTLCQRIDQVNVKACARGVSSGSLERDGRGITRNQTTCRVQLRPQSRENSRITAAEVENAIARPHNKAEIAKESRLLCSTSTPNLRIAIYVA
jgi:hypothetical protein